MAINNTSINLLGTTSRVATPTIGVKIGNYIFGIYNTLKDQKDYFHINPRFVKSLDVQKINGIVNKYNLVLEYPITNIDDPNLLDKIFASVSDTRDISFSYGDASTPSFSYKQEEALMLKVRRRSNPSSAVKTYTISAVSTGVLNNFGTHNFPRRFDQPSKIILELLNSPKYGLKEVFTGMTDVDYVYQQGWIERSDKSVNIEEKTNITVLDYLNYLVSMMSPNSESNGLLKNSVYMLVYEDIINENANGPIFKVVSTSKLKNMSTAYEIDVGFPSQNIVTDWTVEEDETYSIYYKFAQKLQPEEYTKRLDDDGNWIDVYAPAYANIAPNGIVNENIKTWWTKVTEFPIKASITFRGLLRPAVLMSYVRINIYYYGRKDIDSGLYVVTSQEDKISESGYFTTLKLLRVGGDDSYVD